MDIPIHPIHRSNRKRENLWENLKSGGIKGRDSRETLSSSQLIRRFINFVGPYKCRASVSTLNTKAVLRTLPQRGAEWWGRCTLLTLLSPIVLHQVHMTLMAEAITIMNIWWHSNKGMASRPIQPANRRYCASKGALIFMLHYGTELVINLLYDERRRSWSC